MVIEQCEVESIPPRQLQDIFDQVTDARENRNKAVDDAHSYDEPDFEPGAARRRRPSSTRPPSASAQYVTVRPGRRQGVSTICCRITRSIPDLFAQQKLVKAMGAGADERAGQMVFCRPAPMANRAEFRLLLNREPPEPKTARRIRKSKS